MSCLNDSIVSQVYEDDIIKERHRHRYEFNNAYKEQIENAGMKATGLNPKTGLVEIVEIPSHPWFVGCSITLNIRVPLQIHILYLWPLLLQH